MDVVSITMHPLKCDASEIVCRAPVIYMVKQLLHLPRIEYTSSENRIQRIVTVMQQWTRVF
jgi:hypothetical protein